MCYHSKTQILEFEGILWQSCLRYTITPVRQECSSVQNRLEQGRALSFSVAAISFPKLLYHTQHICLHCGGYHSGGTESQLVTCIRRQEVSNTALIVRVLRDTSDILAAICSPTVWEF